MPVLTVDAFFISRPGDLGLYERGRAEMTNIGVTLDRADSVIARLAKTTRDTAGQQ